jgi:hypothetical protein
MADPIWAGVLRYLELGACGNLGHRSRVPDPLVQCKPLCSNTLFHVRDQGLFEKVGFDFWVGKIRPVDIPAAGCPHVLVVRSTASWEMQQRESNVVSLDQLLVRLARRRARVAIAAAR